MGGKPRKAPVRRAPWQVKAEKALTLSIEHWDRLVNGSDEGFGIAQCACCDEWYKSSCYGCPIRERTEEGQCDGSPYPAACRELQKKRDGFALHDAEVQSAIMRDYLIGIRALVRDGTIKVKEGDDNDDKT
jgi:hypothetical protein